MRGSGSEVGDASLGPREQTACVASVGGELKAITADWLGVPDEFAGARIVQTIPVNGAVGGWVGGFFIATDVNPFMPCRRVEPNRQGKPVGDVTSSPLAPRDGEDGVLRPERVDDFVTARGDEGLRVAGSSGARVRHDHRVSRNPSE